MDMQANHSTADLEGFALQRVPARICVVCKVPKEQCEAEFEVKKRSLMGTVQEWGNICSLCRELKEYQNDHQAKPGGIARVVDAICKQKNITQAHDLLGYLYKEFGEAPGVAVEMKKVYDGAMGKDDYKVAARVLATVVQLQVKVSGLQQEQAVTELTLEQARERASQIETALAYKLIELQKLEGGSYGQEVPVEQ